MGAILALSDISYGRSQLTEQAEDELHRLAPGLIPELVANLYAWTKSREMDGPAASAGGFASGANGDDPPAFGRRVGRTGSAPAVRAASTCAAAVRTDRGAAGGIENCAGRVAVLAQIAVLRRRTGGRAGALRSIAEACKAAKREADDGGWREHVSDIAVAQAIAGETGAARAMARRLSGAMPGATRKAGSHGAESERCRPRAQGCTSDL